MNIKIVIALVVVIILIVVGVFLTLKPSPEKSQEAVDSLANAAASSEAMPESEAKAAAEVAKANIPADNTEAKAAVDKLAAAATTPAAAPVPAVAAVANTAAAAIAAPVVTPPPIATAFGSASVAAPVVTPAPVITAFGASAGVQNPCALYNDESKGVSKECYNQIWKEAGCGGNPFDIPDKENWNKDKTLAALRNDAKVWYDYANNRGSAYHKGFCKSLPLSGSCAPYTDESKGVSNECYKQIWREAGCGGNPFDIPDKENWNKDKTLAALRNDAKVWYDYANNRGSAYHKGFCKDFSIPSSYIRYVRNNRNYLH